MSFYTSLIFCRPTKPPAITGGELSQFIKQLTELGILQNDGLFSLKVRFGKSIDQDHQKTSYEEINDSGFMTMKDIDWDIELTDQVTIQSFIDALATEKRFIYRASISLGMFTEAVIKPITRINSPENTIDFCPGELSIQIGPIESCDLQSETPTFDGWIGTSLHGYGYLFPWTKAEVIERLDSSPEIQRIAQFCRLFWPAPATRSPSLLVKLSQLLKKLWSGLKKVPASDWHWIVQETG